MKTAAYGEKIRIGIGFATGRKSFKKVLKTYIYSWEECGLVDMQNVSLNLLVAYDLQYKNTKPTDYTYIGKELRGLIDDALFINTDYINEEKDKLIAANVLDEKEAAFFFGRGYAAKRNVLLYAAIKNKLDCLLFLDDDEYPMAVTKTRTTAIWGGQHVLSTHLTFIRDADITHGHHCGYISPIPYMEFNDKLSEDDFRLFIEAISNDIINWASMQSLAKSGGVSYADTKILVEDHAEEVPEVMHTKFISGANLCINLTDPSRVYPFYNPVGARGEDTFLSTCLSDRKVLRVPCYTFHDGFSTYNHLLNGVLPIELKPITHDSDAVANRFYYACIGWIRYKPLLLYITQREVYEQKIQKMREDLAIVLPKIAAYFEMDAFLKISEELAFYHKNVKKHYDQFQKTKQIWVRICNYLQRQDEETVGQR